VGRPLTSADLGRRVVGIDFSEVGLHVAHRLNPTMPLLAADMRALPVRSDSMAGVVAFYSMIYEAADGVSAALAEFRRVLRPDGALLIAVHAGALPDAGPVRRAGAAGGVHGARLRGTAALPVRARDEPAVRRRARRVTGRSVGA
jgi:SAM-dependent methyltransferase